LQVVEIPYFVALITQRAIFEDHRKVNAESLIASRLLLVKWTGIDPVVLGERESQAKSWLDWKTAFPTTRSEKPKSMRDLVHGLFPPFYFRTAGVVLLSQSERKILSKYLATS
jgi:hypothetical protein